MGGHGWRRGALDGSDGSYVKYTTADGLAHDGVRAIAIDGAGRKWFGTHGGVSVYDQVLAPVRTYLPMLVNGPSAAG